jgi:hypothetical protein
MRRIPRTNHAGHHQPYGVEWAILDLLLDRPHSRGIGELIDEIGNTVAVAEALEALQSAGLIECTDAFVRLAPM